MYNAASKIIYFFFGYDWYFWITELCGISISIYVDVGAGEVGANIHMILPNCELESRDTRFGL